ncbi:MAG: NADPH-dependent F420 reductase [Candidatus Nitrosotenuis sp.]|nr:NADPH-dependent F420 reductase [Candidatus Nitrosotenuis sp.]
MKIGIIGGTGGMGKGFALRWCKKHEILIGSRDAQRASDAAAEYSAAAKEAFGNIDGKISGIDNLSVAKQSDVLILAIPYENIDSVCPELLANIKDSCTVVSPIVPMVKTDTGFEFIPLKEGKQFAHQMVQKYMKNKQRLVSAFHVISEKKLADPKFVLDYDIFVCGDDKESVDVVNSLVLEIAGLRPIFLGSGALAYQAEIATPLLLNAMIKNKLKNPGIKIL